LSGELEDLGEEASGLEVARDCGFSDEGEDCVSFWEDCGISCCFSSCCLEGSVDFSFVPDAF
jgi:hypothetical protein